jgi:hypothetical protein
VALLPLSRHHAQKKSAHAAEQDRPDVRQAREAWFDGQLDLDPARLIFIDKTGASTKMARTHGRALRGQRLRVGVPHGHWKTTTLTAGLSLRGVVAPLAKISALATALGPLKSQKKRTRAPASSFLKDRKTLIRPTTCARLAARLFSCRPWSTRTRASNSPLNTPKIIETLVQNKCIRVRFQRRNRRYVKIIGIVPHVMNRGHRESRHSAARTLVGILELRARKHSSEGHRSPGRAYTDMIAPYTAPTFLRNVNKISTSPSET